MRNHKIMKMSCVDLCAEKRGRRTLLKQGVSYREVLKMHVVVVMRMSKSA